MLNKKKWLLPLMITGAAISSQGAPAPVKSEAVPLPENYTRFFPALDGTAGPVSPSLQTQPAFRSPTMKLTSNSDVYGYLYYFTGNKLDQGFYRINPTPGPTHLWTDSYTADWSMSMTGGWLRNGKLCGINTMIFMGGMLGYGQIEVDIKTGEILDFRQLTVASDDFTNIYLSTAYRDLNDRVYGYGNAKDDTAYAFKSAPADNIDESEVVKEIPYEEMCVGLCYNVQDDMFYGVTTEGKFVSVSPEGEQTVIMPLNIRDFVPTVTGLVYSPRDNAYIYNAYLDGRKSAMYAIDPDAKTCTKLYDNLSGEEYTYMVCTADNASEEAPARVTAGNIDFKQASPDGSVSFTMPGRTAADQPLAGTLDWKIYVDGVVVKTGTATAGSPVTADLQGIANGMRTFAIAAGKDGKWSVPVTVRKWIGSDYPKAPSNVTLSTDKATWDAPVESEHGGYVDFNAITYTVSLNGEKIAETAATECAVTLPTDNPYTSYQVQVTAKADNKVSEPAMSNFITYGAPLEVPETGSLHFRPEEEETPMFQFVDIDGKLDSEGNPRNWHFSTTMGFPSFASGADGEDLLIFPPIKFDNTSKAYRYEMEAGLIQDIDTTGTIEVLIGKEPTIESMTKVIIPPTHLMRMGGVIMTEFFSVPEPGTYYIGVLTHTNKVAMHISDMDIKLTDRSADVPETVSELTAKADPTGKCKAIATFRMPEKTLSGAAIPADTELTATITSRKYVPYKPYEGEVKATATVKGRPGEVVTGEVESWQGYNTIGVSVSMNEATGVEATTWLYTGLVRPYTVNNFKAEVSEDNMSIRLSWDPPTEGEEAGIIGDSFLYTVWYYNSGWTFLADAGWDTNSYTVELDASNPQTILNVGVMAYNEAGQSDHIASASSMVGTPYTLPMNETLKNGDETYSPIAILRPDDSYNDTYWMVSDPADLHALFANESGWAYIGYVGTAGATSGKSRISLPKFSTDGKSDVKVTLNYWGGPYEASYKLLSDVYGSNGPEEVGTYPNGDGWISNTLSLPAKLNGLKWVQLMIDSYYPDSNSFAMISGYSISGASGVEGVDADGEKIFATPGMIHVAGLAGEALVISDLSGRVVASRAELDDLCGFAVAPGTYVVKAGKVSRKLIVK